MNHRNGHWRWVACLATIGALVCACTGSPPGLGPQPGGYSMPGTGTPSVRPAGPAAGGSGSATPAGDRPSGGAPSGGTASGGAPSGDQEGTAGPHPLAEADLPIPTGGAIDALAASLPKDRIAAADKLVTAIYGSDPAAATTATATVLREAGLPLVTADGRIVSLPDGPTAVNVPIYIELVPVLAASLRDGDVHEPADLADLLHDAGLTTSTWSDAMVIAALAAWGKQPGDAGPGVLAGAAVRASAWHNGQLLDPAVPGVRLDALAPLLFLAHAMADEVAAAPSTSATSGTSAPTTAPGLRRAKFDCADVATAVKDHPGGAGAVDYGRDGLVGKAIDSTTEMAAEAVEVVGMTSTRAGAAAVAKGGVAVVKGAGKAIANATTVANAYLLLHGIRLRVTDSTSGKVHFFHDGAAGDAPSVTTFTANATFHSPLPQDQLPCYGLAGLKVPANGPLTGSDGFAVKWRVYQEDRHALLRPLRKESQKLLDGELLSSSGTSTLVEYTRAEKAPPKPGDPHAPGVHHTPVTVIAKLDQRKQFNSFFDVISLMSTFGVSAEGITKAMLPNADHPFLVEYHAPDTYVIKGSGYVGIPIMGEMHMTADLYSCNGLQGPWKGSFVLYAKDGGLKELLESTGLGSRAEDGGWENKKVSFTLDPTAVTVNQTVDFGKGLGMTVSVDQRTLDGKHVDGEVGRAAWTIDGADLSGLVDSWPFQSGMTFHIVGVPSDSRCPGVSVYDNPWPYE